ncbi:GCG_CRPN prefix-to-repeats domain-containing protein [Methylobacterium sp. sgz302541]|uniref:GCG_CRPN prefix-to-repeats domain-containing protein n=1 Tax=unclassified Methylobacterium TaxID=2615210 RepID=UPI003D353F35
MSTRWMLGVSAALALGGLGAVSTANAAPIGPGDAAGLAGGATVERVAMGCGPGFGRDAWGRCRPFARPRYYGGPRCFWRPSPFGPRRVCRY